MILFDTLTKLQKLFPETYNSPEELQVNKFKFDSRQVDKGDVFIALKAERDGHNYISAAAANQAALCIVESYCPDCGIPQLVVDDTWSALNQLAKTNREYYRGKVISITGSCGKTTVKSMLSEVLPNSYSTYKNFNGLLGLPITLANLDHSTDYAILEMGTDAIGNIRKLTNLAQPNIAVVTCIAEAHIEAFKTKENIIAEKLSIANGLKDGGVFIIPHEYKQYAKEITDFTPLTISVHDSEANCYASKITAEKIVANINGKIIDLHLPDMTEHKIYNALVVLCVIDSLNFSMVDFVDKIINFKPLEGRGEVIELENNITLTDESYNANPLSMTKTLEAFEEKISNKHKMVILGDMLELGEHAEIAHKNLAERCQKFSTIITVGNFMKYLHKELDFREHTLKHFDSAQDVIDFLQSQKIEDKEIFIKGSNGSNVKEIVNFFKQEYKNNVL